MGGGGGGGGYGPFNYSSGSTESFEEKEKKAKEKLAKEFEEVERLDDDKIYIFISHQNRDAENTQRAHEYADYIEENSEFKVNIDKDYFPKKQLTNLSEINDTVKKMMDESDIFVALYHPVKDSNRYERSDWYNIEAQKAKYRGKPIVHVFLDGSKDSGVVESSKSYKIHYQKGEHWKADLLEKIKEIAQKHLANE